MEFIPGGAVKAKSTVEQRGKRGAISMIASSVMTATVATLAASSALAVVPPTTTNPPTIVLPSGPIGRPTTTTTTSAPPTTTTTPPTTTTVPPTTTDSPTTSTESPAPTTLPSPPSSAPSPPTTTEPSGPPDVPDLDPIYLPAGPCSTTNDDYYSATTDVALVVSPASGVLQNDKTCEGLDYWTGVSQTFEPEHGSLTIDDDGAFVYTPDAGFTGQDSFIYALGLVGVGAQDYAEVRITVGDCTVIAQTDNLNTQQESPLHVPEPGFLGNDVIDCPVFGVEITTLPFRGQYQSTAVGTGTFDYTPNPGFFGVDTFGYAIVDASSNTLATGTVTIAVAPSSPCAAVANDDNYGVVGDTLFISPIAATMQNDVTCGTGTYGVWPIIDGDHGVAVMDTVDGDFTYTPADGFTGADTFTYALMRDFLPVDVATVHIQVTDGCGYAAVADHYTTPFETTLTLSNSGFLDNDADLCPVFGYETYAAGHGTVITTDGYGTFQYIPDDGFSGLDSFTYRIYDPVEGQDDHTLSIGTVFVQVAGPPPVDEPAIVTTTVPPTTTTDEPSGTTTTTSIPATTVPAGEPTTTSPPSVSSVSTTASPASVPPATAVSTTASSGTETESPVQRVFTLTVGPTNPTADMWSIASGPSFELESDGTLYFRGPDDSDRLYPELLVTELDGATTERLVALLANVGIDDVGGTTEHTDTLSHPPVAILVVGDGGADETFTSYRIAEETELSPATAALVVLIDEVASLVDTSDAEAVTSGRAIVVAEPTAGSDDTNPSPWPAPIEWSAMTPSIGNTRCALVEGDALRATLDAYDIPHGPHQQFDTGDGTLVVTGVRMLMPSEQGCPT